MIHFQARKMNMKGQFADTWGASRAVHAQTPEIGQACSTPG